MSRKSAQNYEVKILDAAETMIRSRGYNGVSFREIADAVGVKSSSVHYYYPTKGALGVAVARRYTDNFLKTLGNPEDASKDANEVLEKVRELARHSLKQEKLMCLCGMLGAEVADLPAEVADQTRSFFLLNSDWLVTALSRTDWGRAQTAKTLRKAALKALSTMEGALIVARSLGEPEIFEDIEMDTLSA